jgi:nitrate/TMAO reductase-like tetraheme cytochrome c subunit
LVLRIFNFFKQCKKSTLLAGFILLPVFVFSSHEVSIRYFQDYTCVVCHEMKAPITKWQDSGTAQNHYNCGGCHFDAGFKGWMDMNVSAVRFLVGHFQRDPDEPLKPREEPLFLEEDKEPGYWSHVPNSRCFKCHEAKNHKEADQVKIHQKLIKGIASQPCKDCHNHEMRKGQKFYEKVSGEEGETDAPSS